MKAMVPGLLAAAAILLHDGAASHAQSTPSGNIDHLICYRIDDKLKPAATVDMLAELQPDFSKTGCTLMKPVEFCVPASKVNVAPAPPDPEILGQGLRDDYICYQAECPDKTRVADRTIADQFGSRPARKFRVDKICVPARKTSPPCSPVAAGPKPCGGACPTPDQRCDFDKNLEQCVCAPEPCGGKPDKRGVCGGECPNPALQCRPAPNNECICQPPPPPCALLNATVPVCGGVCPNPTDACALNALGECVCQPPPPACQLVAGIGQCGGACPSPTEICRLNPLGMCVCQVRPVGPELTFIGVAQADGVILQPTEIDPNGIPVYDRPHGTGFLLFAEYRIGASSLPVGEAGTNGQEFGAAVPPDFQPFVDMPLGVGPGLGSVQVCDDGVPMGEAVGGVPVATGFGDIDALKDFACRFVVGVNQATVCTRDMFMNFNFASPLSQKQFCTIISQNLSLQSGNTMFTARAADTAGNPGNEGKVIIRIP